MTPIRETIARAMHQSEPWSSFWSLDDAMKLSDAVLRALDEAGRVVVRRDEFFASRGREPCAMELEWARQRAQDLDLP